MLRSVKIVLFTLLLGETLQGCLPKQKSDAEVNYAVGEWWKDSRSNLLVAVKQNQSLEICFSVEGNPSPQVAERDVAHFERVVRTALGDWFASVSAQVQIKVLTAPCANDLSAGKLQVVLHYDEPLFQSRISQTSSPTLGVFLIGDGGLHLNVKGVLNPGRDPTSGYKTALHELGHAMGLNHSQVPGAVMQPMLSRASSRLTADDVAGLRDVWNRIQAAGRVPQTADRNTSGQRNKLPQDTSDKAQEPRIATQSPAAPPRPAMDAKVRLAMRYDSWFKLTTAQSYVLSDAEKCALKLDQKILVQIQDGGQLQAGHLRVVLAEELPDCRIARVGQVGFLYSAHID